MNFGQWIGFILLIIAVYILWNIRQLILLLFTAAILATSLNFLVRQLMIWVDQLAIKSGKNWQLNRNYAVTISIILFLAVFTGFLLLILPPFINQFEDLIKLVPQGISKLSIIIYNTKQKLSPILQDSLPNFQELLSKLQPILNQIFNSGWTFVFSGLGAVLNSLLLLVVTLMFLAAPLDYRQGFIRLFPSFYRHRVNEILQLSEIALQELILRVLINILVITLGSFFGLLILGIPFPLAQGMLAGLLSFIPYIGSTISVIFPLLISLIDSTWKWWVIILLYFGIYQLKTNLILPKLKQRKIIVLPAIMILSQLFFTTFFGVMGLFFALPLTVIAKILFQEILIKDILNQWNFDN